MERIDILWITPAVRAQIGNTLSMAFMYMLLCSEGSYYVGSARDLDRRMDEHASGKGAIYTSRRLPVELVYAEEYAATYDAYAREKQVQGWSRRKREALINGDFKGLSAYSARATRRRPKSNSP